MKLRTRNSRPSYAAFLDIGSGDDGAGPSKLETIESGSSGDDFHPPDEEKFEGNLLEDSESDAPPGEDASLDGDDGPITGLYVPLGKKPTGKRVGASATATPRRQTVTLVPGLSRPVNRQNYALPTPSIDHRHRSGPLYRHTSRVERLTSPPKPFGPSLTTATKNWTFDSAVSDRVSKASGYNVGSGPVWELMEDRAWWKESVMKRGEEEKEKYRRPKVHKFVQVQHGWEVLNAKAATRYLPYDELNEDESTKPPQPVVCHFGPFGSQTRKELKIFETLKLSSLIPESNANVFNAGASVWGLDWCPIFSEDLSCCSYKQYLAVAPMTSQSHSPEIGFKRKRPSFACIQIWCLSPTTSSGINNINVENVERARTMSEDFGQMACEMVLCIESGPAHDIKWCPLPTNDPWEGARAMPVRKLGLLAGTFEDGSLSVYAVPEPSGVSRPEGTEGPVFVKVSEPLIRIELEDTSCWTLDWANSEVIAVGCTNGSIAVYNIQEKLKHGPFSGDILPTHYIAAHQAAIRAIQWIRAPPVSADGVPQTSKDPFMIISGGYDGCEILTDLRDGSGNIMNRTRDVINTVAYSTYAVGAVSIDHENTVKVFTVSPSMLGRGHTIVEPGGPVWSLNCSDYHPQLALGSADGTLLTTNILKSTRRSGAVPFFAHKIYQLDYSRQSNEFRMLERFLPQETLDRPAATRMKRQSKTEGSIVINPVGTGAWPGQVGVQRVAWNAGAGLSHAPLLASATGSGLCRVDWLLGRLLMEKRPYGGIEGVRMEVDNAEEESDG